MFNQIMLKSSVALAATMIIPSALAMDIVNLKTTQAGLHQLSHQDLAAYGIDLSGEAVSDIALANQGSPIQIQVTGSDVDTSVFGLGSTIRFIAQQIDTLYTDTNVYTLRLDSAGAQRVSVDTSAIPARKAASTSYLATKTFAPQAKYSFTSPDRRDPWFAKRMVAVGAPSSESIAIELTDLAPGGNSGATKAKLSVDLWGASSIAGAQDDHHVRVKFNDVDVVDGRFDGLSAKQFHTALEEVRNGANVVELNLPMDTGYEYDAVNVNSVTVKYPRQFIAIDNRLDFSSTGSKFKINDFQLDGVDDENNSSLDLVVMRQDSNGIAVLENVKQSCRASCRVELGGTGRLAHYYVSSATAMHQPVLAALPVSQDITAGDAKYLIISHPDFVGADANGQLEALAAELESEMGSADVVDVEAIYAQFGHHLFDPSSIQDYIKFAHANRGTEYVLLVGGDVYDYRQFENEDASSFIPSLYAATGNNITFAPVDAKYADINDDNVPDLAIGRLPIRTVAQLSTLLAKRVAYLARDYQGKALLVADEYDDAQQYDFASDADEVNEAYLVDWSVEKAYVDELGVSAARARVVSEIESGTSLAAFFGHSSTNQWSFNGLFTGPDAASLQNQGKPTVVTQWGCWNAYYVSPNEDSMGHRFMMEGDRGAVAVMGASTLTNANSERKLARLVFERLSNGERLGDAVVNAKQAYAQDNPDDLDVLLGWTVLGMPELFIN